MNDLIYTSLVQIGTLDSTAEDPIDYNFIHESGQKMAEFDAWIQSLARFLCPNTYMRVCYFFDEEKAKGKLKTIKVASNGSVIVEARSFGTKSLIG
jgi:hypothetical protein